MERKEFLKEKIRKRCREMVGKRLMPYGRSFGKSRSIIRSDDGFLNVYIKQLDEFFEFFKSMGHIGVGVVLSGWRGPCLHSINAVDTRYVVL